MLPRHEPVAGVEVSASWLGRRGTGRGGGDAACSVVNSLRHVLSFSINPVLFPPQVEVPAPDRHPAVAKPAFVVDVCGTWGHEGA